MIIRMDKPIECSEMCKIIQKIIGKHEKETGSTAQALSINIVTIQDEQTEQKCLTDET